MKLLETFKILSIALLALAGRGMAESEFGNGISNAEPENQRAHTDIQFGAERAIIYQNATNIDKGFALSYSRSRGVGKLLGFEIDIPAEVHIPDNVDPSLKFYALEGPIRLYIPNLDVAALHQPTWRYKECDYSVKKIFSLMQTFIEFDSDLSNARVWRFLVEARCDDAPGKAVQYLFGNRIGLMSFTLGEISQTEAGDESFSPLETYFWHPDGSYGFGDSGSVKP